MTTTHKNPHFQFVERAPYELGRLLNKLPTDFSSHSKLTADERLIAEAANLHAETANSELMHGLEALGHVVAFAAVNGGAGLDAHQMMSLGALIKHMAVEAQFLQELEFRLTDTLGAGNHGRSTGVVAPIQKVGAA